ncbi:MAG: hypothetical protein ABIQ88_20825 [Chitinophagaceae bacterium]
MKKVLAISVAFMYLAITSGLVLQIHYCMGKEIGSSVKFAETTTHTCGECGMQNAKNKCCHDEVKFIKLQDVHKQVSVDYQLTPPVATAQEFNLINPSFDFNNIAADEVCNNSPPDDDADTPSIFLLNSVFRI